MEATYNKLSVNDGAHRILLTLGNCRVFAERVTKPLTTTFYLASRQGTERRDGAVLYFCRYPEQRKQRRARGTAICPSATLANTWVTLLSYKFERVFQSF
jgi:hypothetical protein